MNFFLIYTSHKVKEHVIRTYKGLITYYLANITRTLILGVFFLQSTVLL